MRAVLFQEGCRCRRGGGVLSGIVIVVVGMRMRVVIFVSLGFVIMIIIMMVSLVCHCDVESSDLIESFQRIGDDEEDEREEEEQRYVW